MKAFFIVESASFLWLLSSVLRSCHSLTNPCPTFIFSFSGLLDSNEVFCKFNGRDLEIIFEIHDYNAIDSVEAPLLPRVVARVLRGTNTYTLTLEIGGKSVDTTGGDFLGSVFRTGEIEIDLSSYFEAIKPLSNTLYIPAFRNIINIGANDSYYTLNNRPHAFTAFSPELLANLLNKSRNSKKNRRIEDLPLLFGPTKATKDLPIVIFAGLESSKHL